MVSEYCVRLGRTAIGVAIMLGCGIASSQGASNRLIYLRDVDATILQDMRYAGANNFTGKVVPGYEAAECMLLQPAAEGLRRVQLELRASNLSLKVYDCYRPQRSVRAFLDWVSREGAAATQQRFFPRMKRGELVSKGYISAHSVHAQGLAVDLTLVSLPHQGDAEFAPGKSYGPCAGPASSRAPDNGVDMGTEFDCFDAKSHTASSGLTAEQKHNRRILVDAMAKAGFRNYAREWWHFTYGASVQSGPAFDTPIVAKPAQ